MKDPADNARAAQAFEETGDEPVDRAALPLTRGEAIAAALCGILAIVGIIALATRNLP